MELAPTIKIEPEIELTRPNERDMKEHLKPGLHRVLDDAHEKPAYVFPSTVQVDLNSFSGVWFETHRSLIPSKTFEKDLQCVTVEYGIPEASSFLGIFAEVPTMTVNQSGRKGGPTGPEKSGTATLWQFDANNNSGKLVMTRPNKAIVGSYYVHSLGEKDEKHGLYSWAVITNLLGNSVWILARKPQKFYEHDMDIVLKMLEEQGFNKDFNRPIATHQGADCIYPSYVHHDGKTKPKHKPKPKHL